MPSCGMTWSALSSATETAAVPSREEPGKLCGVSGTYSGPGEGRSFCFIYYCRNYEQWSKLKRKMCPDVGGAGREYEEI